MTINQANAEEAPTQKRILVIGGPRRLDIERVHKLVEDLSAMGGVVVDTAFRDYQVEGLVSDETPDSRPNIIISDGTTYSRDEENSKVPIRYDARSIAKGAGAKYISARLPGRSDSGIMKSVKKALR